MSDESVFALIAPEAAATVKSPRFKSQRAPQPTASTFGFHGTSVVLGNVAGGTQIASIHPRQKGFATFGRSVSDEVDPKAFLKKSAGEAAVKSASAAAAFGAEGSCRDHEKRKAAVPKRDEKPVMGLKTDKNFVVANAVENILALPKHQGPQQARAVERTDYGQVPAYIHKIKSELKEQYALVDSYKQRKAEEAERFAKLGDAEHQELLNGLRRLWETLNKEFQTMGFSVETYSQKRHQEEVESELRRVEAAIQRVKKPCLYIYDDTK